MASVRRDSLASILLLIWCLVPGHTDAEVWLELSEPELVFDDPTLIWDYDVSPDGQTFYMLRSEDDFVPTPTHITVLMNWDRME